MSRKRKRRDSRGCSAGAEKSASAGEPRAAGVPSPPSTGRRWLFRSVLFAAPWLFFVALEVGLRLGGYGVPMSFTFRQDVGGETRLLSNPFFTWRFFEPGVARLCPPFSLAPHKPKGVCRVFLFGGSAAEGDPEPSFGIARMLDVMLRDRYPGVEFEVVNAATAAINSHVVYAMARAAADLDPDVFVIYVGNNEVVGPFGAGTALTAAVPDLRLLRAGVALRATRVGQLVGAAVHHVAARRGDQGSWHGMEMFLGHQVPLTDPHLQRTYGYFARNLEDTCRAARRAGVPVVLSTLAVNLRDSAPFASQHSPGLTAGELARWEALFAEARRLQAAQQWAESIQQLQQASAVDDQYAELHFRWGRCAWNLGRYGEAREHFERARDLDTLRFRADARINQIVRDVGGRLGEVQLVDAADVLERTADHGIPGDDLLLDHVHFNFSGNYRLSAALLDAVDHALPDWVRSRRGHRAVPSENACARALVFTELDRYMIDETMVQRLAQPPFTAQATHQEEEARYRHEMEMLRVHGEAGGVDAAVAEYRRTIAAGPVHWSVRERYASIERRLGNQSAAEEQWRLLVGRFPQYPSFHLQLAYTLRDTGRYAEAEAELQQVLRYAPESALTLVELAKVAHLQGKTEAAVAYARRAVAIDPRDATALFALATSLCPEGACDPDARGEAVRLLRRAQAIDPSNAALSSAVETIGR